MDFIDEVTKQTAKIINNATSSISRVSNLVGQSTDAMGKIVILKSNIDSLNRQLNKLYRKIGYTIVHDPDMGIDDLTKEAKDKYEDLKDCEAAINNLKASIIDNSKKTSESLKENSENTADILKQDVQKVSEEIDKKTEDLKKVFDKDINKIDKDLEE